MNKPTTIGIDLAKKVFQVAVLNSQNKLTSNKAFSRVKLIDFMAQHRHCVVGLEACGSAHYWARLFSEMGHAVKLLPPAYVKGLVYGNKHDVNDAKAIALAAAQAESPTVCVKTPEQLSLQALMRVRERRVSQRTDCANQIRGLLYEHGIVINQGLRYIQQIPIDTIPEVIRPVMVELLGEYESINHYVKTSDQAVQRLVKAHPIGQRLLEIPGFGVMNGLAALIVNPSDFRNGRHYAAYLGLVPKHTGTGV